MGVVAHNFSPSTQGQWQAYLYEFKASQSYIENFCIKTKQTNKKVITRMNFQRLKKKSTDVLPGQQESS